MPEQALPTDAATLTVPIPSATLATTMVLRGAAGCIVGAAVAPVGKEGLWAAAGFAMGATVGEVGIIGVALVALWRKAG